MIVRPAAEGDFAGWAALRRKLWPDVTDEELPGAFAHMLDPAWHEAAFVAEDEDGGLIGFAEASVRSVAEGGPEGPAAYLEGIYVEPGLRRQGVGKLLLAAVERWGRDRGLPHLGSDALIDNEASHAWHRAVGFGEVERLVVFGKPLG